MDNATPVSARSAIPGVGSAPMSAEQRRWLAALYEANFAAVFEPEVEAHRIAEQIERGPADIRLRRELFEPALRHGVPQHIGERRR